MDLPRYFVVGERPVKFVATADGGQDVLAFDWRTGAFVREMRYLSKCSLGGGDVDEVTEAEFEAKVALEGAARLTQQGRAEQKDPAFFIKKA